MIFWSSDLDYPRRASMCLHLFKPFGNQIVTFMTIYVSKPTSLTHIWVEQFSNLSKYNLCLFGIRKLGRRAFFFADTGRSDLKKYKHLPPLGEFELPCGRVGMGQNGYRRHLEVSIIAIGFISTNFRPEYTISGAFQDLA